MLGSVGMQEIVILLAICAFIFGAKKLPEIGRGLGQGIREFRNAGRALTEHHDEEGPDGEV